VDSTRKEREIRIDLRGTDGLPTGEGVGDFFCVAQGAEQDQDFLDEVLEAIMDTLHDIYAHHVDNFDPWIIDQVLRYEIPRKLSSGMLGRQRSV
jgi:hypothetical protein